MPSPASRLGINSYYCDVYYDSFEEALEWSPTAIWFAADLGEEQALARSQHCWICEPYLVVLPIGGYTIVITENGDESINRAPRKNRKRPG